MNTHQELLDAIAGTLPSDVEPPPKLLRWLTGVLTELARSARLLREIVITLTTPRLRATLVVFLVAAVANGVGVGDVAEQAVTEAFSALGGRTTTGRPADVTTGPTGLEVTGLPPCLPALGPQPSAERP